MLNPNKIRWMTRASIFEKEGGAEDLERNTFFFSDYVRYSLLKNFISVTVAGILILLIYILSRIEYILTLAAEVNLGPLIRQILIIYVIALAIFTVIGAAVYVWQYRISRDRVKRYYMMLKLIEKYGREDRR